MRGLVVAGLSVQAGAFRLGPVDLEVEAGEYLVLMGATGSGKSLLIKALCGLIQPLSGRIVLGEVDVTHRPPRSRQVGYVPQTSALFPHLTAAGNVTFAAWARGVRPAQALAEAADIVEALGLAPLLERRPTTLSGGERQKVALARALFARPRLLALDEPVSALDEPSRRDVCAVLKECHRRFGVTTIHVCHSLAEARSVATRVGAMEAGRLVGLGPLEELLAAPPASSEARRLLGIEGGPDPAAAGRRRPSTVAPGTDHGP
jgi:ABC-type sugar transport system ATPase subunit